MSVGPGTTRPLEVPATNGHRAGIEERSPSVILPWVRIQAINVARHAAALAPFRRDEFGKDAASPSEAHIQAVNQLIDRLRQRLLDLTGQVTRSAGRVQRGAVGRAALRDVLGSKERAHDAVRAVEQVWDFYFEVFGQRQSPYADWLLSADRIALDCYQTIYLGLGVAKSIPSPPPFSYMRTGFSPATFRRGISLRRLGRRHNPFPLIQLPFHRLVNPWTLGAILHEVSHNLQNELGLHRVVPQAIGDMLLRAGIPRGVAATWVRWNRESFADLSGLLLGGPAVVGSLMDVVGRSPAAVLGYDPRGPHPTPYLRTLLSTELLRRMGFPSQAGRYRRAWLRLYPDPSAGSIPRTLLATAPRAIPLVVEAVCYRSYPTLGNRSLAQVIRFEPKEQSMIEEAGRRFAAGVDPGVVPERFLIGASRFALTRRLARPGVIAQNFYRELARR